MKILRYLSLVVLALAFVVASAVPASATTITVQSIVIPNYRVALNPGETLYLVIYADRPFISSAGIPIQAGSPANGRWYKRVTCSVVGTDVTIPSFTLDSTTDAQDIPGKAARYSAYFYANTRNLGQYGGFESFRLLPVYTNPTPTDATWAQIRADNTTGAVMSIDRTTLTSEAPGRAQFGAVEIVPLEDVAERPRRKPPFNDAVGDSHCDLERSVTRVEVRRSVIVVVHDDHDAEEPRELRHATS